MQPLTIDLGSRSYPILIGPGLLARRELLEAHIRTRSVLVVTNTTVAGLHLQPLLNGLAAFKVETLALAGGEALQNAGHHGAHIRRVDRRTHQPRWRGDRSRRRSDWRHGWFAAACYQRGIAYAQVPTILLAQVDSAVGGKTGVNHPARQKI